MRSQIYFIFMFIFFFFNPAGENHVAFAQPGSSNHVLRIFIDCDDCDHNYIRNTIKFVNFVTDPHAAQVHVLITDQKTASEGRLFTLRFIGKETFTGMNLNLWLTSSQEDTDHELRLNLTNILQMGLMPYVSQTPMAKMLDVRYDEDKADSVRLQNTDAWNYWIFYIDLAGELQAEESQNMFNIVNSLAAERITDKWKLKSELIFDYQQENYTDDDQKIRSQRKELECEAEAIRSINSHWSAGLFSKGKSSTYLNTRFSIDVAPGIEYNFFPWEQSDHHTFTLSYSAGIRSFSYHEETLFGKLNETLSFGRVRLELGMTQTWGTIDASLENYHYYHDFTRQLFKLENELSLRITRGLAFTVELVAESIHDQLYLPRGDATLEEILLKQKKLATTFEISAQVGLRYSFGSIYNNIVNRRF